MKAQPGIISAMTMFLFFSGFLFSPSSCSEKALWIEVRERGERKTTIAVTEGIARAFLESRETNLHFTEKGKKDLITREMLQAVLDGRKESIEIQDTGDGSEATIYLKQLDIPGKRSGKDRLVLETYKSGTKSFRVALPEIELEASDREGGGEEYIKTSFGWKALLPFLAKTGGAVYINDHRNETEIWVYVE